MKVSHKYKTKKVKFKIEKKNEINHHNDYSTKVVLPRTKLKSKNQEILPNEMELKKKEMQVHIKK